MNLLKHELELLRHGLFLHREMVRSQHRIAMNEHTDTAQRDMARFDRIIRESLKLDDKLSDAINGATLEGSV